jgi:3-dehydroquinate dehydratase type I
MSLPRVMLDSARPLVAGSFGNAESLAAASIGGVRQACDLVEIRLDLLESEGVLTSSRPWAHLEGLPLLFTARRGDEGGAANLPADQRMEMLAAVLGEAALVDVEWASAEEMAPLLAKLREAGIPWVASWHDFEGKTESFDRIPAMATQAAAAGAACFKAALRLHDLSGLARLAELQKAAPTPTALMGMGPLAPASRLLCAQHGSVLNYGYIGNAPTAPGQWSAALLKEAIYCTISTGASGSASRNNLP